jgi:hypothetical protein
MSTQQERAAKARAEKLAAIDEQVEAGSLVIREMTPAERAKYPKRDTPPDSRRRGGRPSGPAKARRG